MSEPDSDAIAQARLLDESCDRFESAWQHGEAPRLEEYLMAMAEPARAELLRELLRLDLHYRKQRGDHFTQREYQERFATFASMIPEIFDGLREPSEHPAGGGEPLPGISTAATSPFHATDRGCSTSAALLAGAEIVPGYTLVSPLGKGGFGEVWKATAPGGVPVALKFLRCSEESAAVEARGLEFMKSVVYPHLLSTFGIWNRGDLLIIGMELADETLLQRLQRAQKQGLTGIPAEELLEYLREAAKAIDFLNEVRGIIHRDIKPQNLLLVGGGIKVGDFGLARVLERSAATMNRGLTPAYAAPEFFQGQFYRQSDQYSLAVSYCHLQSGCLPFQGAPIEIMAGHLNGSPDVSFLPIDEQEVVARALAKRAEDRWPTCLEFWTKLSGQTGSERKTAEVNSEVLLDTTLILGPSGGIYSLQYVPSRPVWVFLADVFHLIATKVAAYTYGKRWVLRDAATARVFDIGSPWARSNRVKEDARFLQEVGIQRGMRLEIVPMR